jgi:hypothetical protein
LGEVYAKLFSESGNFFWKFLILIENAALTSTKMRHSTYRKSRAYMRPKSGALFGESRTETLGSSGQLWEAGKLRGESGLSRSKGRFGRKRAGIVSRAMHSLMVMLGIF